MTQQPSRKTAIKEVLIVYWLLEERERDWKAIIALFLLFYRRTTLRVFFEEADYNRKILREIGRFQRGDFELTCPELSISRHEATR